MEVLADKQCVHLLEVHVLYIMGGDAGARYKPAIHRYLQRTIACQQNYTHVARDNLSASMLPATYQRSTYAVM